MEENNILDAINREINQEHYLHNELRKGLEGYLQDEHTRHENKLRALNAEKEEIEKQLFATNKFIKNTSNIEEQGTSKTLTDLKTIVNKAEDR